MQLPDWKIVIDDPPDLTRGEKMEFHLVYDGNLLKPSQQGRKRVWEKHAIRGFFSHQLKRLWEVHPALKSYAARTVEIDDKGNRYPYPGKPFLDHLADWHKVGDLRIIPITTEANGLVCSLDVLLLLPEFHGVMKDGDIDNRLKTLVDALKKPKPDNIRKESGDDPDPNPMYCLLEDDEQITGLSIKTDRLLYPMSGSQDDAIAIVRVTTAQVDPFGSPWELHL